MELKAGTTDGAAEKHVPIYEVNGNVVTVKVGSVEHPMTPEHYIQWIDIQTTGGIQRVNLTPSDNPEATFTINEGDEVIAVYEYCNLHGLWKA
ncbi:MAG: desulfoferrodoxin, partial [Lachnospiraceae bacterium]|nr:desulfoferrodoxin [Lachnospiraceae bacterium]